MFYQQNRKKERKKERKKQRKKERKEGSFKDRKKWDVMAQWISHLLTAPRDLDSQPGGGTNLLKKRKKRKNRKKERNYRRKNHLTDSR